MFITTPRPTGAIGRTRLHRLWSLATGMLVLILLGTACSDASTAPQTGGIRASVRITGGEPSESTYTLVVDSSARTFAFGASQAVIMGLTSGPHTLTLKVLAKNCTVTGLDPTSVAVRAGTTADVTFDVECKTTGIQITTHTTGVDIPSSYTVLVNGAPQSVASNGLLLVSRLEPGPNTATLTALGDNCHVDGGNPITIDLANGAVTPVVFDVVCVRVEQSEKIAYEVQAFRSDTIHLINPDGSGDIALGPGSGPSWSPDGSKLAFSSAVTSNLVVVTADGRKVELGPGVAPSWSPDGSRLVFSTQVCSPYDGCFTGNLAVMDADGNNVQALPGPVGFNPAWAPSGDVIAFVVGGDSLPQLYLARPDGSMPVKLSIPGVDGASGPAWSPDGRRIAFQCFLAPASTGVCVANKDGTGLVILMSTDLSYRASVSSPAWNPDGRSIVFTATTSLPQILVMAADGSSRRFITYGDSPAWSRDGAKLVFVADCSSCSDDGVFEIGADGSNLKRLTTGHHIAPTWRP